MLCRRDNHSDGDTVNYNGIIDRNGTFTPTRAPSRKRVYCAGPMRSCVLFNFPSFDAAARILRRRGYDVVNPAEMDRRLGFDPANPGEITPEFIHQAMWRDIREIVECDSIAMLPGWEKSAGATVEHTVAEAIGCEVLHITQEELDMELANGV